MWFRLANHSPGCIRRREVLVSPRGPLFLASRITMVGNSGVPKTFCQTPDGGSLAADIRDQDQEFRPFRERKANSRFITLSGPPPFDGRATTPVKTGRGDGYFYSATCLGAVPVRVNRVNCDPDSRCPARTIEQCYPPESPAASSWVGRPPSKRVGRPLVLGLVARQFLGWSPMMWSSGFPRPCDEVLGFSSSLC